MFSPLETMTREEKQAEVDQLAALLARHRNTTPEIVLATLFTPPKIGRPFQATVTRSDMQRRVKSKNFEQGKLEGHICEDDLALKKGTPAYFRAATAYFARCCATAPGYEEIIAPGLFRPRNLGWMDHAPEEMFFTPALGKVRPSRAATSEEIMELM